jgi:CDP-glucose 4,6-dehydratase
MHQFKGKKVLITGHTGFKGGWLALWLKHLGATVSGLSLDPPSSPNFFDALELSERFASVHGNICDPVIVGKVMSDFKPDFVFHLAAQALVRDAYDNPIETYETYVMGTAHILQAVRTVSSVKGIVIVTSDKCYENTESIQGYTEKDRLGGSEPYASSKACAELVTSAFSKTFFPLDTYGQDHFTLIASVRAGNVLGGGDWGHSRLIPDCVRSFHAEKKVVLRYPNAVRPWQYVLDLLYGYLLVGERLLEGDTSAARSWNFSPNPSDGDVTVEELVQETAKLLGKGAYEVQPSDGPKETSFLRLDSSLARHELGWKSQYSFNETLERTLAWYKRFYRGDTPESLLEFSIAELAAYEKAL